MIIIDPVNVFILLHDLGPIFLPSIIKMSQNQKLFFNIALLAATQVALFYGAKYLVTSLDPNSKKKEEARLKSSEAMKRLGVKLVKWQALINFLLDTYRIK